MKNEKRRTSSTAAAASKQRQWNEKFASFPPNSQPSQVKPAKLRHMSEVINACGDLQRKLQPLNQSLSKILMFDLTNSGC